MNELAGKVALVTGGSRGIGAAIARRLAQAGAAVAFTYVSAADKAQAVAKQIDADGGTVLVIQADNADPGAITAAVEQTVQQLGRIDILVNNAALLLTPSPTADVPEQLIRDAFAVNVTAAFLLTGSIAPAMAQRGRGSIINIGSINGLLGMGGSALYSATKATIHSLTKSWTDEYGPQGVRVNTVAPGPSLTERSEEFAEYIAPVLARVPSRRASTMAEVAAAVVFLASDDAANILGATLSVDGGWAAV